MEVKYRLVIASLIITLTLLGTIVFLGTFMIYQREKILNGDFDQLTSDIDDLQTLMLLSDSYGGNNDFACKSFSEKLQQLDTNLWDLGNKLDKYRVATEEFEKSSYYLHQKMEFNKKSLKYYLFLKSMVKHCGLNKKTILYFYKDSKECPKCDGQSFILRDISLMDKDINGDNREVAIFSFDTDLGLESIDFLTKYYNFSNYPCLVINNEVTCGIKGKKEILQGICSEGGENLSICLS